MVSFKVINLLVLKHIAIKQVKFFENGMQKDGYAVSLKDSQALLNYCKELDSDLVS